MTDIPIESLGSPPTAELLELASQILVGGELVVAPTETRYGLLADATSADAAKNLGRVKGRSERQPISVFVADLSQAKDLADLTPIARRLARAYLPGPLTLVVKTTREWPLAITTGDEIGLRISSEPIVGQLCRMTGLPLTATSANLSGQPEKDTIAEIAEELGEQVSLYLDAGPRRGTPSTVVRCTGDKPEILRQGVVPAEEIEKVARV